MAEPPKQPRNAEVVSKEGQFNQAHARWWDSIAKRAYSAVQSFNEFFALDTIGEAVDTANDYLLIYNASEGAAQKVPVATAVPSPTYNAEYELITTYSASDWVKAGGTSGAWQLGITIPADCGSVIVNYRNLYDGISNETGSYIAFSVDNGSNFLTAQYMGTRDTTNVEGAGSQVPHHNDWDDGEDWRGYIELVNHDSASFLKRATHFFYESGGKRGDYNIILNTTSTINYVLLSFGVALTGSTLANGDVQVWGIKATAA